MLKKSVVIIITIRQCHMPVVGVIWSVCHRTMLCLPTSTAGIDRVVVWTEAREHLWIRDCVTVTVYRGPGDQETWRGQSTATQSEALKLEDSQKLLSSRILSRRNTAKLTYIKQCLASPQKIENRERLELPAEEEKKISRNIQRTGVEAQCENVPLQCPSQQVFISKQ